MEPNSLNTVALNIEGGIARLTLNRPEVHNAFNAETISELREALASLAADDAVRILVLRGEGKHFCAGGDLNWMKSQKEASLEENLADSGRLADLLDELNSFPKPTIAEVQGAAFGGALGLISCCDMVVASDDARFCLSEVKLGLSPATISPYVIAAMGARQARRYFLTAELINAEKAYEIGLIHQIVSRETLSEVTSGWIKNLLNNGPQAIAATKQLIRDVSNKPVDDELKNYTSELIAHLRVGDEGQEGLTAFFEKRKASYATGDK
ncbi:enoyl-CoA hydratase/isomerase family protein [Bacterioplanoides sp.]|uniref:enoyl-CoA hydratase/isomerase family protein n=1 Tax=Bacterioplanoides sp. TaxID=2066072 RepID=UPI003B5A221E